MVDAGKRARKAARIVAFAIEDGEEKLAF